MKCLALIALLGILFCGSALAQWPPSREQTQQEREEWTRYRDDQKRILERNEDRIRDIEASLRDGPAEVDKKAEKLVRNAIEGVVAAARGDKKKEVAKAIGSVTTFAELNQVAASYQDALEAQVDNEVSKLQAQNKRIQQNVGLAQQYLTALATTSRKVNESPIIGAAVEGARSARAQAQGAYERRHPPAPKEKSNPADKHDGGGTRRDPPEPKSEPKPKADPKPKAEPKPKSEPKPKAEPREKPLPMTKG